MAPALLGLPLDDASRWTNTLNARLFANQSAKSALEMAAQDLAAQALGLPLHQALGGKQAASQTHTLRTDYTISLGSASSMAAAAAEIVAKGFSEVKVKLGGHPEEDLKRLAAIRSITGPELPLRLDANQGWNFSGALRVLTALADDGHILFCEAPLPRWQFTELPRLRKSVPIKIMADESCLDAHDAERLLAAGACDYLNVKIGKAGGLGPARAILKVAETYGVEVQIGGFLESRLGFTAAAHLALCSPTVAFVDFDTPLMFEEDHVLGGLNYGSGGYLSLAPGLGLGAQVAAEILEKQTHCSFMS
ncbi:MAG: dipeptide epimerase [Lewinella sp.]|nr:dipeptide epimerase [Lewinella sp.]